MTVIHLGLLPLLYQEDSLPQLLSHLPSSASMAPLPHFHVTIGSRSLSLSICLPTIIHTTVRHFKETDRILPLLFKIFRGSSKKFPILAKTYYYLNNLTFSSQYDLIPSRHSLFPVFTSVLPAQNMNFPLPILTKPYIFLILHLKITSSERDFLSSPPKVAALTQAPSQLFIFFKELLQSEIILLVSIL